MMQYHTYDSQRLIRLELGHTSPTSIFQGLCILYCICKSFITGKAEQILQGTTVKLTELRWKD